MMTLLADYWIFIPLVATLLFIIIQTLRFFKKTWIRQTGHDAILGDSIRHADYYLSVGKYEEARNQYQELLNHLSPRALSGIHGHLLNNLGICLYNLALAKRDAQILQQAIQYYAQALDFRTIRKSPIEYAVTQNNVGVAYWSLSNFLTTEREESIKRAISAYQEALIIRNQKKHPLDYAATQDNLGTAYATLAPLE
ncbi:MAG: hypothetical protein ABH878_09915, partial [bacterium]